MSEQNNLFMQLGQSKSYSKGQYIFKQGDTDANIYFIKSGLLKAYYLTDEGKEFVKSFLLPGELIGSLRAVTDESACQFSVVCLEDTEVLAVPFKKLYSESLKSLETASVLMERLIELACKKEKREYEFLCLNAQQRYELLEEQRADLLEKVPLNEIAKYLGITAIALSRIRKRLRPDN